MSIDQWEFGVRPEVEMVRFVRIQGEMFRAQTVLEVLEGLTDADILSPINIFDKKLVTALITEGLAYEVRGGYGGTEQTTEALERILLLVEAEVSDSINPRIKYGYVCSATFDCELGNTDVKIYPSFENIKNDEPCVDEGECAAIKVLVYAMEAVE